METKEIVNADSMFMFDFGDRDVRAVVIDGVDYLVAKDVALALGYKDTVNALKQHLNMGGVKHHPLQTKGGRQNVRVIGLPDTLRLITHSKLPNAVEFEKLIFEVILPQIHKTGSYSLPKSTITNEQSKRFWNVMEEENEKERLLIARRASFATVKIIKSASLNGDAIEKLCKGYSAGFSYKDIGKILGVSEGTVSKWIKLLLESSMLIKRSKTKEIANV